MEKTDKVLDPACGSGGFLLKALDAMREKADKVHTDKNSRQNFDYWHSFAEKYLYGIEINEAIARVSKMNMILHDDGHTNVICCDALENLSDIQNINRGFETQSFDYIFANPPFGAVVKKTEREYLGDFELGRNGNKERPAQKTEILFIERFWQFLKPNGKIAVVLPDGILTNSSLQYVREWMLEHFKLLGVISLPQDAFRYYGAGVKSSVVVMQKWGKEKEADYNIFMATAEKI
jgi:type I restriction enzyme M protein